MLVLDEKQDYKVGGIYSFDILETPYMYIGSSKAIKSRIKEHENLLNKGTHHNSELQDYFNKGFTIKVNIVECVEDIETLWERELYHIYANEEFIINQTHFTKNAKATYISKEVAEKISKLYANGMSGTQISLEVYGTRNKRSSVNKLIKGDAYPNFKYLFEYRKYTQQNKKRGTFTCNLKYRSMEYTQKLEAIEVDKQYIIEKIGILSGRQIAKNLNLNYRGVNKFIEEYKKNNNIVWEERLTKEIKSVYTKKHGKKTTMFDASWNFIEQRPTVDSFKKDQFYSQGILKSSNQGILYKNYYFKVEENEL